MTLFLCSVPVFFSLFYPLYVHHILVTVLCFVWCIGLLFHGVPSCVVLTTCHLFFSFLSLTNLRNAFPSCLLPFLIVCSTRLSLCFLCPSTPFVFSFCLLGFPIVISSYLLFLPFMFILHLFLLPCSLGCVFHLLPFLFLCSSSRLVMPSFLSFLGRVLCSFPSLLL